MNKFSITAIALSVLLTACGGGGGGEPEHPAIAVAQAAPAQEVTLPVIQPSDKIRSLPALTDYLISVFEGPCSAAGGFSGEYGFDDSHGPVDHYIESNPEDVVVFKAKCNTGLWYYTIGIRQKYL